MNMYKSFAEFAVNLFEIKSTDCTDTPHMFDAFFSCLRTTFIDIYEDRFSQSLYIWSLSFVKFIYNSEPIYTFYITQEFREFFIYSTIARLILSSF